MVEITIYSFRCFLRIFFHNFIDQNVISKLKEFTYLKGKKHCVITFFFYNWCILRYFNVRKNKSTKTVVLAVCLSTAQASKWKQAKSDHIDLDQFMKLCGNRAGISIKLGRTIENVTKERFKIYPPTMSVPYRIQSFFQQGLFRSIDFGTVDLK